MTKEGGGERLQAFLNGDFRIERLDIKCEKHRAVGGQRGGSEQGDEMSRVFQVTRKPFTQRAQEEF